ncbi:MAG: protease modulator HflK [Sedimentisphaerales bacterium]|nr:protease modulator HflK [Sedimentisphaerales bacterium]
MTQGNIEENESLQAKPEQKAAVEGLDPAGRSLAEALRISFGILKFIMVVLVVLFLASGFRTVGPDEQALVLRFGKIRTVGQERLLGPGLHWVFPYPIDEIVKIPITKKINIVIEDFWYYERPEQAIAQKRRWVDPTLNPVKDGYCITRSERQDSQGLSFTGSDYNIVHNKWQLTYQIIDPERFFSNVYVKDIKPGEIYLDAIKDSVASILRAMVCDAVVTAMVNYTIDEALRSQATIPGHVRRLLQEKLDEIDSGIKVVSIQLTDITWPQQVDGAFLANIKAKQASQKGISQARSYYETTLSEAGGPRAEEILDTLKQEELTGKKKGNLWEQLSGLAQGELAKARAYRTKVVETAKANAEYLHEILPEYRKRPKLVVQKIYQDAIEYVLNNAQEKMIIQPTEGAKEKEMRILINRDPSLKSKSEEKR